MKSIRPLLLALLSTFVALPGFASPSTAADQPASGVTAAYLQVQVALAADDLAAAKTAGAALQTAAAADPACAALTDAAGKIAGAGDIAAARTAFLHVSQALIPLLRQTGAPELYLAHCPMAFRGKGGDWLQSGPTINNPYYGKSMLRCGVIKERIAGGKPASAHEVDASRAELDRVHQGVPGYQKLTAKTAPPAAGGMDCCTAKP